MVEFSSWSIIKKAWDRFKKQWFLVLQLSVLYTIPKLLFGDTKTTWCDLSNFGIKQYIFFSIEHIVGIFLIALLIQLALLTYKKENIGWGKILHNISSFALRLGIFSTILIVPVKLFSNDISQFLNAYQPPIATVLVIGLCTILISILLEYAFYDYAEHVSHSFTESFSKAWQIVVRSNWRIITCIISTLIISLYFTPLYLLASGIKFITNNTFLEMFTKSLFDLWVIFSSIYIYKELSTYSFKK